MLVEKNKTLAISKTLSPVGERDRARGKSFDFLFVSFSVLSVV
jgi:hypothetical protein